MLPGRAVQIPPGARPELNPGGQANMAETDEVAFQRELAERGYMLEKAALDICECGEGPRYTVYVQECSCPDCGEPFSREETETRLAWNRRRGCEGCVMGHLGCLDCGGHYNGLRWFCGGADCTDEPRPLDPSYQPWADQSSSEDER